MTEELKPCPFCGGYATIRHTQPLYERRTGKRCGYFAMCEQCLTSSDNYNSVEACAEHWNRRVSNGDVIPSRMAELPNAIRTDEKGGSQCQRRKR